MIKTLRYAIKKNASLITEISIRLVTISSYICKKNNLMYSSVFRGVFYKQLKALQITTACDSLGLSLLSI